MFNFRKLQVFLAWCYSYFILLKTKILLYLLAGFIFKNSSDVSLITSTNLWWIPNVSIPTAFKDQGSSSLIFIYNLVYSS